MRGRLSSKFLLNTNPMYLSDIIFDQTKIKFLVEGSFMNTPEMFDVTSTFVYSQDGKLTQRPNHKIDTFLTPFLYAYNNPNKGYSLNVNDVPELLFRDYVVRNASKIELLDLVTSHFDSKDDGRTFDVSLSRPELFLKPRVSYITEVLRQSCYISQTTVAIVDRNMVEAIEDEWKTLGRDMVKLQECLVPLSVKKETDLSFSEYVEKQVLLDTIKDEFLHQNFIKHQIWPYHVPDTIGYNSTRNTVFVMWDYFYSKYISKPKREAELKSAQKSTINV